MDRDAYKVLQIQPDAHQAVVKAAYRALAALYHPDRDGSEVSLRRMVALNAAYEAIRTPERRQVYDAFHMTPRHAPAPVVPVPPRQEQDKDELDFGRYKGWTIADLARQDPDYLRWLSRHSSGIRYRQKIEKALRAASGPPTASERVRGRR